MQQSPNPAGPARKRKYRRFDLQFPVSLTFPSGNAIREINTVSRNVSMGGLLVKADDQVPLSTEVNLVMNVVGPSSRRPVLLMAEGRVVRVEPLGIGFGYTIAVECKQPLAEVVNHFSGAH